MRTIDECKAVLDEALSDDTIFDFFFCETTAAKDRKPHFVIWVQHQNRTPRVGFDSGDYCQDALSAAKYVESLYHTKENIVSIPLSHAVERVMDTFKTNNREWIIAWGNNHNAVGLVRDAFRKYQSPRIWHAVIGLDARPTQTEEETAGLIVHVTGGPSEMTLDVTKNRHGRLVTLEAQADCYFKENTVPSNITPKPWPYQHLHPDSAGYAECFKILREAKKDGVISNWGYTSNSNVTFCPVVWISHIDGYSAIDFKDEDGTKGDIGILREAADYVLGLKHEQWVEKQKPDLDDMSFDEQLTEAMELGIRIEFRKTLTGAGELEIFLPGSGTPSWRITEEGHGLRAAIRDVRELRGQKK